jgi:hypothetical protein
MKAPDGSVTNVETGYWESTEGDFVVTQYKDGTLQVAMHDYVEYAGGRAKDWEFIAIERVIRTKSRRKKWAIITRGVSDNLVYRNTMYPPLFAKGLTFDDFPTALITYETIMALKYGMPLPRTEP